MRETNNRAVLEKLDRLRTELVELAFRLECRGRLDGADVAVTAAACVGELCDELAAEKMPDVYVNLGAPSVVRG